MCSRVRGFLFLFRAPADTILFRGGPKSRRTWPSLRGATLLAGRISRRFATRRAKADHFLAGCAPPVLTATLAFGEDGRQYALATAGVEPDLGGGSQGAEESSEEEGG